MLSHVKMNDDRALVFSVLQNDQRAFRSLVQQHERLVWHMVTRITNRTEDCEDICQEVFLRVYRKLPDFRFQSKLSTWIATVAYRTAINYVQKEHHHTLASLDLAAEVEHPASGPDEQLQKQSVHAYVHEQIATLPVHYRAVLTMFHLEEMSLAEIQAVTDMPIGTVKNYLFRARKLLKERLQHHFTTELLS